MNAGWEYYRCVKRSPYCSGRIEVQSEWHVREDGTRFKQGRSRNAIHICTQKEGDHLVSWWSFDFL
jgi:hypothetical protein